MNSCLRYLDRIDTLQAPVTDRPRLARDQSAEFVGELGRLGDGPVFEDAVTYGSRKRIASTHRIGRSDWKSGNFDELSLVKHGTACGSQRDPGRPPPEFPAVGP